MIRYNWKRIIRKTGHSSKEIFNAFKAHYYKGTRLPKNKYDPLYKYYFDDFSGESFIIHPEDLILYSFKWKPKEIAQYIGLAAYRSYVDYALFNKKSLEVICSPLGLEKIKQNRLLKVVDDDIYFYYEETAKRRNELWV